jgi:amidase
MIRAFTTLWSANCAADLNRIARSTRQTPKPDQVEPSTWGIYEMGQRVTAADYLTSVHALQGIGRLVARFFLDYDVWLTPTLGKPPVPLGNFNFPSDDPYGGRYTIEFVPFTGICNITGQPAMSAPLFWNSDGLPIGVQFIGRFGDEATLFRLAAQLEAARPWTDRRPPAAKGLF